MIAYLSDRLDGIQVVNTLQISSESLSLYKQHGFVFVVQPTGSNPISFMTVIPAFLQSSSSSLIAGETYDVVTTCFLLRMAALMTCAW